MSIECWRLDAGSRTAVFASFGGGVPSLVHLGATLPDGEDLETLARLTLPNIAGGQLDPLVPLTLLPTALEGWQGHPGIVVEDTKGKHVLLDWRVAITDDGAEDFIVWTISGADGAVTLQLVATLDTRGLLSLEADRTKADGHCITWLAPALPVPTALTRIMDHGGRWTGEFQRQERRFTVGQHVRESREGRTGHAHFPGMIFAADDCGENSGSCMGVTLEWSGGHRIIAEEIPDGRRQVQCGFMTETTGATRRVVIGWSDSGFNGLSQGFTAHVRTIQPKKVARPVHYNCWEAVYFRHSVDELKEIASKAAKLGAERFVLDDGWFKGRNDDTTSLGDWTVDTDKYPDGLHPLVDHIRSLGMQFGIWFEPEMVNKQSNLYRAHPDWVLGPDNQPSGRGQYVLDLSRPGVADYLFDAIAAILKEYPVGYIKWDHNRILTGEAPQQTVELYKLLDRLGREFPHVEIESCASGGGRIDYGILRRTTRVWLSDSNDAAERLRMQHEASFWLPPEIQGSHVGPRHCHTSGRVMPMAFRAWVAAQRHMGFEMDPRELTDEEAETLNRVTTWYRDNRDFLFAADQYRLESHDPEVFAETFVARDRQRFILFRGQSGPSTQIATRPITLAGLDSDALYDIRLVNTEDIAPNLNRVQATGFLSGKSERLSGAATMSGALRTPNAFPLTMMVFEGKVSDT